MKRLSEKIIFVHTGDSGPSKKPNWILVNWIGASFDVPRSEYSSINLFRKETHNPSPNLGLFERNPPLVFLFHECAAQIAPPVFTFKCNNWLAVSFGFQAKLNFVPSTFGASQFVCRVTKLFLHWSYASCKQGYIKVSTKSVQRRKRQSYLHMNVPKYQ